MFRWRAALLCSFITLFAWVVPVFANDTYSTNLTRASSQYFSIADASQTGLDLVGDLTLETWVKLNSAPTAGQVFMLMTKWNGTTNQRSYEFSYQNNGGTLQLAFVWSDDGTVNAGHSGTTLKTQTLTVGTWTHVALVWHASTHKSEFFINGSSIGTVTSASAVTSIFNGSSAVQIGAEQAGNFYDGRLVEFRAWNTARTSSLIAAKYNCYISSTASLLVANWRFQNNANDSSGNNNNLTNNNSATFGVDAPTLANCDTPTPPVNTTSTFPTTTIQFSKFWNKYALPVVLIFGGLLAFAFGSMIFSVGRHVLKRPF